MYKTNVFFFFFNYRSRGTTDKGDHHFFEASIEESRSGSSTADSPNPSFRAQNPQAPNPSDNAKKNDNTKTQY